jgi:cytochrome c oxidase subunit 2
MIKWNSGLLLMVLMSACWHKPKKSSTQNETQPFIGNVEAGRLLYNSACKTCHGEGAEGSKKFQAPTLANTDDWYLYRQLMNYRNGLRGDNYYDTLAFQMAAMAKTLKDTIAVRDVVAYIKIMPGVNVTADLVGDKKNGKNIYQGICGSCHGPNAVGNEKLNAPQLSGLNDWYLKQQIWKFKKAIRGAHPDDKLGAQMVTMMAMLPDEKAINDVIAYMQSAGESVSK